MTSRTAISLFSGAGGMDLGFLNAGFDILAAVENDPSCCDTLRANLDAQRVWERDISTLKGSELLERLGLKQGQLDILFGGPPCQSFSLAGNRQGLNDPRGQMVGHFVRLVRELMPKVFVMENVKGMLNWSQGAAVDLIESEFGELFELDGKSVQYHCVHDVLNAADFGVPQRRERLFIVGNRLGKRFKFPVVTHSSDGELEGKQSHVSVGAVIGQLPKADPPSATALRVSGTIKGRITRHGY